MQMRFLGPQIDEHYRRYTELLLRHDELISQLEHGSELDSVESEMSELWDALDSIQQASVSGLSSDLNWLRRGGELAPRAKTAAQVSDAELEELSRARDAREWHKLLHCLRPCTAKISPFEVAFLRATAWKELGFAELSQKFRGFAVQLEPNNSRLAVLALSVDKTSAGDHAASVD